MQKQTNEAKNKEFEELVVEVKVLLKLLKVVEIVVSLQSLLLVIEKEKLA